MLLGLAIATKFYPLMFVGALFLLTLRTARWRPFLVTTGSAVAAWLVVNVPFMILAWDGWRRFYVFSQERGVDWGSPWLFFQTKGWPVLGDHRRQPAGHRLAGRCSASASRSSPCRRPAGRAWRRSASSRWPPS